MRKRENDRYDAIQILERSEYELPDRPPGYTLQITS